MEKTGYKKSSKPITNKDLNLDMRVHSVYEMIQETDPKKAFKSIRKSIDQSKYLTEELFYKIVLSYLYKISNHLDTSDLDPAKTILEEVASTLIGENIYEKFIVDHFMTIAQELGYSNTAIKVIEAKSKHQESSDQNAIIQLFEAYVSINDFMKMNAVSKKIGLPKYEMHSIQSIYMLSQSDAAPPGTIDLAFMFMNKHIGNYAESDKVPSNEGKLYIKILNAKNMHTQAIDYIQAHPEIYSSTFELSLEIKKLLEHQVDFLKSSDIDKLQPVQ